MTAAKFRDMGRHAYPSEKSSKKSQALSDASSHTGYRRAAKSKQQVQFKLRPTYPSPSSNFSPRPGLSQPRYETAMDPTTNIEKVTKHPPYHKIFRRATHYMDPKRKEALRQIRGAAVLRNIPIHFTQYPLIKSSAKSKPGQPRPVGKQVLKICLTQDRTKALKWLEKQREYDANNTGIWDRVGPSRTPNHRESTAEAGEEDCKFTARLRLRGGGASESHLAEFVGSGEDMEDDGEAFEEEVEPRTSPAVSTNPGLTSSSSLSDSAITNPAAHRGPTVSTNPGLVSSSSHSDPDISNPATPASEIADDELADDKMTDEDCAEHRTHPLCETSTPRPTLTFRLLKDVLRRRPVLNHISYLVSWHADYIISKEIRQWRNEIEYLHDRPELAVLAEWKPSWVTFSADDADRIDTCLEKSLCSSAIDREALEQAAARRAWLSDIFAGCGELRPIVGPDPGSCPEKVITYLSKNRESANEVPVMGSYERTSSLQPSVNLRGGGCFSTKEKEKSQELDFLGRPVRLVQNQTNDECPTTQNIEPPQKVRLLTMPKANTQKLAEKVRNTAKNLGIGSQRSSASNGHTPPPLSAEPQKGSLLPPSKNLSPRLSRIFSDGAASSTASPFPDFDQNTADNSVEEFGIPPLRSEVVAEIRRGVSLQNGSLDDGALSLASENAISSPHLSHPGRDASVPQGDRASSSSGSAVSPLTPNRAATQDSQSNDASSSPCEGDISPLNLDAQGSDQAATPALKSDRASSSSGSISCSTPLKQLHQAATLALKFDSGSLSSGSVISSTPLKQSDGPTFASHFHHVPDNDDQSSTSNLRSSLETDTSQPWRTSETILNSKEKFKKKRRQGPEGSTEFPAEGPIESEDLTPEQVGQGSWPLPPPVPGEELARMEIDDLHNNSHSETMWPESESDTGSDNEKKEKTEDPRMRGGHLSNSPSDGDSGPERGRPRTRSQHWMRMRMRTHRAPGQASEESIVRKTLHFDHNVRPQRRGGFFSSGESEQSLSRNRSTSTVSRKRKLSAFTSDMEDLSPDTHSKLSAEDFGWQIMTPSPSSGFSYSSIEEIPSPRTRSKRLTKTMNAKNKGRHGNARKSQAYSKHMSRQKLHLDNDLALIGSPARACTHPETDKLKFGRRLLPEAARPTGHMHALIPMRMRYRRIAKEAALKANRLNTWRVRGSSYPYPGQNSTSATCMRGGGRQFKCDVNKQELKSLKRDVFERSKRERRKIIRRDRTRQTEAGERAFRSSSPESLTSSKSPIVLNGAGTSANNDVRGTASDKLQPPKKKQRTKSTSSSDRSALSTSPPSVCSEGGSHTSSDAIRDATSQSSSSSSAKSHFSTPAAVVSMPGGGFEAEYSMEEFIRMETKRLRDLYMRTTDPNERAEIMEEAKRYFEQMEAINAATPTRKVTPIAAVSDIPDAVSSKQEIGRKRYRGFSFDSGISLGDDAEYSLPSPSLLERPSPVVRVPGTPSPSQKARHGFRVGKASPPCQQDYGLFSSKIMPMWDLPRQRPAMSYLQDNMPRNISFHRGFHGDFQDFTNGDCDIDSLYFADRDGQENAKNTRVRALRGQNRQNRKATTAYSEAERQQCRHAAYKEHLDDEFIAYDQAPVSSLPTSSFERLNLRGGGRTYQAEIEDAMDGDLPLPALSGLSLFTPESSPEPLRRSHHRLRRQSVASSDSSGYVASPQSPPELLRRSNRLSSSGYFAFPQRYSELPRRRNRLSTKASAYRRLRQGRVSSKSSGHSSSSESSEDMPPIFKGQNVRPEPRPMRRKRQLSCSPSPSKKRQRCLSDPTYPIPEPSRCQSNRPPPRKRRLSVSRSPSPSPKRKRLNDPRIDPIPESSNRAESEPPQRYAKISLYGYGYWDTETKPRRLVDRTGERDIDAITKMCETVQRRGEDENGKVKWKSWEGEFVDLRPQMGNLPRGWAR